MKQHRLFQKRSPKFIWLIVLALLSLALWLDDQYFHSLYRVRIKSWRWFNGLESSLNKPITYLKEWRYIWKTGLELNTSARELKEQQMYLEAQSARLAAVYQEYNQLNQLLNLTTDRTLKRRWTAARLNAIPRANFKDRFIIDKGSRKLITEGAMVITSRGVVGKIEQVSANSSVVLPLVSQDSIIPIKILRTGRKGFCAGSGYNKLELIDVPASADVKPGDQLISSDIGGGWIAGFLVGTVKTVSHDQDKLFLRIEVQPAVDILELNTVLVL